MKFIIILFFIVLFIVIYYTAVSADSTADAAEKKISGGGFKKLIFVSGITENLTLDLAKRLQKKYSCDLIQQSKTKNIDDKIKSCKKDKIIVCGNNLRSDKIQHAPLIHIHVSNSPHKNPAEVFAKKEKLLKNVEKNKNQVWKKYIKFLSRANIHSIIKSKPQNYNTVVNELSTLMG